MSKFFRKFLFSDSVSSYRPISDADSDTEIYFDPAVEQQNHKDEFSLDVFEFFTAMTSQCDDCDDQINQIFVYKHIKNDWQITERYLFHAFVVFKTRRFWWSVDKNVDGVTVQRGSTFDAVSTSYRQKRRTAQKLVLVKSDPGRKTVRQLFDEAERRKLLTDSFKFLSDHCKHFANGVFKIGTNDADDVSDVNDNDSGASFN